MSSTTSKARDNQKSRLYKSEQCLKEVRASALAAKHLVDDTDHSAFTDKPYPSYHRVQAYVDAVASSRFFQSRWGRRSYMVEPTWGSTSWAYGSNRLRFMPSHRRSEEIILHEIAHTLTPHGKADHGPEFAAILLFLVTQVMGAEQARVLRGSFVWHHVKHRAAKAIPTPKVSRVVTKVEVTRRKSEAAQTVQLSNREAAHEIRARVKRGMFGAPGTKTREHALATARIIEKGGL